MHKILAAIQWVSGFLIALIITAFALLNRDTVSIVWSPFHAAQNLPLFIPVIAFLIIGFCLGAASMWFNNAQQRRDKRALKRQVKAFEKKLYGASGKALPLSGFSALSGPVKKD